MIFAAQLSLDRGMPSLPIAVRSVARQSPRNVSFQQVAGSTPVHELVEQPSEAAHKTAIGLADGREIGQSCGMTNEDECGRSCEPSTDSASPPTASVTYPTTGW